MRATHSIIFTVFIAIVISPANVLGQTDSLLAQWAEFLEEDSEALERIQEWQERPIYLNNADRNDLLLIPFLTTQQVDSILAFRDREERFRSKRQLSAIIGRDLYALIKELVTAAKPRYRHRGYFIHKNHLQIEALQTVRENNYRGDFVYDYNKFYYKIPGGLDMGFITQKDIGEKSYLDYWNGILTYQSDTYQVILGNYYIKWGQGLMYYSPFGSQKSAMVTIPFRQSYNGGRATLSSSENSNLFGGYVQFSPHISITLALFYSNNERDVRFADDDETIIGVNYTGYHRTISELLKRNQLKEQIVGCGLTQTIPYAQFSILYAQYVYQPAIRNDSEVITPQEHQRQYFKFSGHQLKTASISYNADHHNIALSGEAAFSDLGSPAFTQNLFVNGDVLKAGIKYWRVSKNFQSPYGRMFDDRSAFPQAEEGMYGALYVEPAEPLEIKLYKIMKSDLWRSYFNPLPRQSNEWLMQTDYRFHNGLLTARLRRKHKQDYITDESGRTLRTPFAQYLTRLQIEYNISRQWRWRSRWAFTLVDDSDEKGAYYFQDLRYRFQDMLYIDLRWTAFQTTSYISRLYEYESDLLGSFANYPLYGKGYKWYIRIRWQPLSRVQTWLKYRYFNIIDRQPDIPVFDVQSVLKRELRFQIKFYL
ncbi:MAG: hypothetical protein GF313_13655 [Caldithrix sp.]|nr:hypothetical protein [Caldithrix sp.]